MLGGDAYRNLPLTGALQSTFPFYRRRSSFGDASTLEPGDTVVGPLRGDLEMFSLAENGEVLAVLTADGSEASDEVVQADARRWARAFALDSFNNHCVNHEHDCTATCVKYVKNKLEGEHSLRSHKVPSCRFWFFHVCAVGRRKLRRRGKQLVPQAYVEETDDRNQKHRIQVVRTQPFRSASNDVCQVCNRCNVDYQFLACAPSEVAAAPVIVKRRTDEDVCWHSFSACCCSSCHSTAPQPDAAAQQACA